MSFTCRAHAIPLPCRATKGSECLSHLIYTVRPCLIHLAMPCPFHAPTMPFFSMTQHSTADFRRPCCAVALRRMVGAWHGHGMASVNQTRPHCVNQMGKAHSKPLAARHARGTAWERHAMCESALRGLFTIIIIACVRVDCNTRNQWQEYSITGNI